MRQRIPILSIDIDLLFWGAIALGVVALLFFGWLYFRDWRKQRAYRRYLESKRPKRCEKERAP